MANVREITDFSDPALDVYARLTEAQLPQLLIPGRSLREERPGNLEYRAHADSGGPAVQGVGAAGGQEYRIHAQRRGGAEDGTHIGGVLHIVQHRNAAGIFDRVRHRGKGRPPHGAQHAPGQMVACQIAQ